MRPVANGHNPARTRNSVLLPLPEGPCNSTDSRGLKLSVSGSEQRRSIGQRHADILQVDGVLQRRFRARGQGLLRRSRA